ncbi:MAG: hypothetical protein P8N94_16525, partial [Gammaproteobacteria bacterium]|nr:hypothetical protein [Gammaproteobacteria bacterium]
YFRLKKYDIDQKFTSLVDSAHFSQHKNRENWICRLFESFPLFARAFISQKPLLPKRLNIIPSLSN